MFASLGAIKSGNKGIVKVVIKLLVNWVDFKADYKDKEGWILLLCAVETGLEVVVKLLVERDGVKVDLKD